MARSLLRWQICEAGVYAVRHVEEYTVLRQGVSELAQGLSNELQRPKLHGVVHEVLPFVHALGFCPYPDSEPVEARDARPTRCEIEEAEVWVHGLLGDLRYVHWLVVLLYMQGEEGVGHAIRSNVFELPLACQRARIGPLQRGSSSQSSSKGFGGGGGFAITVSAGTLGQLQVARGPRMRQTFALPQRQGLGGRLQCARQGVIVNCFSARPRGARGKREVADSDALEVPELAVLSQSASGHCPLLSPRHTYGSSHGRSLGGGGSDCAGVCDHVAMLRSLPSCSGAFSTRLQFECAASHGRIFRVFRSRFNRNTPTRHDRFEDPSSVNRRGAVVWEHAEELALPRES